MHISYKFVIGGGDTFEYDTFKELTHLYNYHDIVYIECSFNELTSLPILPNSLTMLYCSRNELTILPTLPNSLIELECSYNKLTVLPTLPNSLQSLNCHINELTSLPSLPNSLQILGCAHNLLTVLPTLPNSLTLLQCSYNKLAILSIIKDSLEYNYYDNNPVHKYIKDTYGGNLDIYCKVNEKFANKLVRWYLDCRENPIYKFCRARLNREYDALMEGYTGGL